MSAGSTTIIDSSDVFFIVFSGLLVSARTDIAYRHYSFDCATCKCLQV